MYNWFGVVVTIVALAISRLLLWFIEPMRGSRGGEKRLPVNMPHNFDVGNKESQRFPTIFDDKTKQAKDDDIYLSVVVPAYNESGANRLPAMMKVTMDYLEKREKSDPKFSYEVVIVNDGSTDNTKSIAQGYSKKYSSQKVRVLDLPINQGKGFAVQQGALHSRGRRILMADADAASEISHVERLEASLDKIVKDPKIGGVAVGSRAHMQREAESSRAWYRNILMYGFHFVVWVLFSGVKINDTQCGFKLFTREAAQRIFPSQKMRRWCFDMEVLFIAYKLRIPLSEVQIKWEEIDGSHLNLVEASFDMGRDMVIIRFCYLTGFWRILSLDEGRSTMMNPAR